MVQFFTRNSMSVTVLLRSCTVPFFRFLMMISTAKRQLVRLLGRVAVHFGSKFQVENYLWLVELKDVFAREHVNQLVDGHIHFLVGIIASRRSIQKRFLTGINPLFKIVLRFLRITNTQFYLG